MKALTSDIVAKEIARMLYCKVQCKHFNEIYRKILVRFGTNFNSDFISLCLKYGDENVALKVPLSALYLSLEDFSNRHLIHLIGQLSAIRFAKAREFRRNKIKMRLRAA